MQPYKKKTSHENKHLGKNLQEGERAQGVIQSHDQDLPISDTGYNQQAPSIPPNTVNYPLNWSDSLQQSNSYFSSPHMDLNLNEQNVWMNHHGGGNSKGGNASSNMYQNNRNNPQHLQRATQQNLGVDKHERSQAHNETKCNPNLNFNDALYYQMQSNHGHMEQVNQRLVHAQAKDESQVTKHHEIHMGSHREHLQHSHVGGDKKGNLNNITTARLGSAIIETKATTKGEKELERAERKRKRERQRREDVNRLFDDLNAVLAKIEKEQQELLEKQHQQHGDKDDEKIKKKLKWMRNQIQLGKNASASSLNRAELIAKAVAVLEELSEERKDQRIEIEELKQELDNKSNTRRTLLPQQVSKKSQIHSSTKQVFSSTSIPDHTTSGPNQNALNTQNKTDQQVVMMVPMMVPAPSNHNSDMNTANTAAAQTVFFPQFSNTTGLPTHIQPFSSWPASVSSNTSCTQQNAVRVNANLNQTSQQVFEQVQSFPTLLTNSGMQLHIPPSTSQSHQPLSTQNQQNEKTSHQQIQQSQQIKQTQLPPHQQQHHIQAQALQQQQQYHQQQSERSQSTSVHHLKAQVQVNIPNLFLTNAKKDGDKNENEENLADCA